MKKNYFLFLLFVLFSQALFSQDILKATGGTGKYKDDIYWINFAGVSDLGPGGTTSITRNLVINGVNVTVIIDNITFSGYLHYFPPSDPVGYAIDVSNQRLQGYAPGVSGYYGIDVLYNINGFQYNNQLTSGLTMKYDGANDLPGYAPCTANFRLRAYATLNGQPLDIGMVFGSAEDDGDASSPEYTQATTNGSNWKLLESAIYTDGARIITYSNGNKTAKMKMGNTDSTVSPSNVALLFSSLQNSSSSNPLTANVQMLGGGKQAIALGVILRQDFGDAPSTYGNAQNIFPGDVTGGTNNPPAAGGNVYLSSGTGGGTPTITDGTLSIPGVMYLGTKSADTDNAFFATGSGTEDDLSDAIDDEDALTDSELLNASLASYTANFSAFKNLTTASNPAYVMAWCDLNRNGIFEANEYKTTSFTANNIATSLSLTWNLVSNPATIGNSFVRFRITTTNPSLLVDDTGTTADERSFMPLANGETEDHKIIINNPCSTAGGNDRDFDGIADYCDDDDDNDGILDSVERGALPEPTNDTDNDGLRNYQDPDTPGYVDANSNNVDDRYDFDGDGIIDQFDADSDGDLCTDANESYHALIPNVDPDNDGTYGSNIISVNAAGRVIAASYTGNTTNYKNNAIVSCIDSDGDGVKDVADADDDNDGVTDTIEGLKCGSFNNSEFGGTFGTLAPNTRRNLQTPLSLDYYYYRDSNTTSNPGEFAVVTGPINSGSMVWSPTAPPLVGHTSGTSNDAFMVVNGTYPSESTVFSEMLALPTNTNVDFGFWAANIATEASYEDPSLKIEIYNSSGTILLASANTGVLPKYNATTNPKVWVNAEGSFNSGNNPVVLVKIINTSGTYSDGNDFAIDDIYYRVKNGGCKFIDTDGDGTPNHLDLDSDGDGCSDGVEAGSINSGITGTTVSGPYGANGLANSLESNDTASAITTYFSSYDSAKNNLESGCADSDSDGIPNLRDIDDDNDGITDCVENGGNDSMLNAFTLKGTATLLNASEVRLTEDFGNQAGQMWLNRKIDFAHDFVLNFSTYLGTNSGDYGADGVAMVFHNSPLGYNAVGDAGDGIGAKKIKNGIALELDTFDNTTYIGDIPNDHGMISDTDANDDYLSNLSLAIDLGELEDGNYHDVEITWDATAQKLSYTVDGKNAGAIVADVVNSYFGGVSKVYFGYTASTGGYTNEHKVQFNQNQLCGNLPNLDSDGDGIINSLDLDSDNDGIYDMIEAGGNFAAHDTNHDGIVDGGVGANGWPDLVDSSAGNTALPVGDKDQDGNKNFVDLDSDNDGIADLVESLSYVPNLDPDKDGKIGTGDHPTDTDGDGSPDLMDGNTTSGLANITNASYLQDKDGDGLANQYDIDSENDGIVDIIEGQTTTGFVEPLGIDTDGDGLDNRYDINNGGTAIGFVDSENDTIPDYLDPNSDKDALVDLKENSNGPSGSLASNEYDSNDDGIYDIANFTDTDGDGLADAFDTIDGINLANNSTNNETPDSLPNSQFFSTPEKDWREFMDNDNDGIEDSIDIDDDNDGILDTIEGTTDNDGDGIIDAFDSDSDNDGISDLEEAGGTDANHDGFIDSLADADHDGLMDMYDAACSYDNVSGPLTTGYASSLVSSSGFTNPNYGLGAPDVNYAASSTTGSSVYLLYDLGVDVPSGATFKFHIGGNSNSGSFKITSTNATGSTNLLTIGTYTINNGGPFEYTYTSTASIRYIKILQNSTSSLRRFYDLSYTYIAPINCSGTALPVPNTDGADLPNYKDLDSDNDGCSDANEYYNDYQADGGDNSYYGSGIIAVNTTTGMVTAASYTGLIANVINSAIKTGCNLPLDSDNDGILDNVDIDDDNDGILDTTEICTATTSCNDADGDGVPNSLDLDSDNDGIYDTIEAGANFATHDTDHDGRINGAVGTNGWPDIVDSTIGNTALPVADKDGDGKKNYLDLDSDNDGISDLFESIFYISGIDPDDDGKVGTGNTPADADADGSPDITDGSNSTGLANITSPDYFKDRDGDGLPNQYDIDSDNDGIVDNIEGQPTIGYVAPSGNDTDGDGYDNAYDKNNGGTTLGHVNSDGGSAPDYVDTDSDNDTLLDLAENHKGLSGSLDATEIPSVGGPYNGCLNPANFTDADGDGLADIFDLISGIATANNTTNGQNPTSQPNVTDSSTPERDWREGLDSDHDGVLDNLDIDDDNDGILDTEEGTTDIDGDGKPNYLDLDSDNDGIYDVIEAGGNDTDNDGYPGTTAVGGPYPAVDGGATSTPGLPSVLSGIALVPTDFDGDGIKNYKDLDSDNDGIYDVIEAGGTDPNNDGIAGTGSFLDADADGIADVVDHYNNLTHTVLSVSALPLTNTDASGNPDYIDNDSDDDACFDAIEGSGTIIASQLNGSGAITGAVNANGFPTAITAGQATGYAQNATINACLDNDSDGVPDGVDLDDDNDGILDTDEQNCTPICTDIDTDGDTIPNRFELDSDNDSCTDANEYYAHKNADGGDGGVYGTGTPTVDALGKVSTAAYTGGTYAHVTSVGTASTFSAQPTPQNTQIGGNASFTATATGGSGTTLYQWQESADNGATWTNAIDNSLYSGTTTNTLTITGATPAIANNLYRVVASQSDFVCVVTNSNAAVLKVNINPEANDDTNNPIPSTAGATAINPLTASDTADDTIASYKITSLPTHGILYVGGVAATVNQVLTPAQAATLTYDPDGTFVGNDYFTFTATDSFGAEDTSPATITIPVSNNLPTANNVTNATTIISSDGAKAINPLSASDTDGTIVSYTISTLPTHGTLYVGGVAATVGQVLTPAQIATLTYDPTGNFNGNETFTFTAKDNDGGVDATPATYTIPIGNAEPIANNITNPGIPSTAAATPINALSATDADGTIASYQILSLPTNGTLYVGAVAATLNQVITPAQAATLNYDPNGSTPQTDSFTYTAIDNGGLSDSTPATFTIPVSNNPPTTNNVTNSTSIISSDGQKAIDVFSATDTDGTIANYKISTLPTHGTLYVGGVAATAGQIITPAQAATLTYDPVGNFIGNETFTFAAIDNDGGEDLSPATYTIAVGNAAPVANNITNSTSIPSTAAKTAISTLTATDGDGTIVSYKITSLPAHGSIYVGTSTTAATVGTVLTPAQVATLKYDPDGTFVGNDAFNYTATDNGGLEDLTPATFTIPVSNNVPVANNVTNASTILSSDGALPISTLSATDTDGTIANYKISTLPTHGTLYVGGVAATVGQIITPIEAANLTYDPAGNFNGNETFTFTAIDNNGGEDLTPATYTIPVSNVAPVALDDNTNVAIPSTSGKVAINPLAATDADGTIASYKITTLPAHGSLYIGTGTTAVTVGMVLTPAQAATLKYDPIGNFVGNDTFTFNAKDNNGLEDATPATVTLPIANNPPTANNVTSISIISSASALAISALSATDTDGTIASYTISTLPAHGTLYVGGVAATAGQILTPAEILTLTFDPAGNFNGNDTFTFTATDNSGETDLTPATYTIPISNAPPVASNVTNVSIPKTASKTPISALNAIDNDGTVASYKVVSLPSHGILYVGNTAVTLGQVLTPAQVATLSYDPDGSFVGNEVFTFSATDNNGTVSNIANFTIPIISDNDNDGVLDLVDLDDDNDGILDTDEGCNTLLTGSWTATGTAGVYEHTDTTNNTKIRITLGNYANFWDGNVPSTTAMDASCVGSFTTNSATPITGSTNSLQVTTAANAGTATSGTFKVEFFNAAGTVLKTVTNPKFHIGRIGGTSPTSYLINSSSWDLQGGLNMIKLSSNATFSNTSTNFVHANIGAAATVFGECSAGMAAATIMIDGSTNNFQFNVTNLSSSNVPIAGSVYYDGVRIIVEYDAVCNDNDQDGIPNSLDIDSDNDGCFDAIEGGANITYSQLSSGAISGGVDANGVPIAISGGQTKGDSQNVLVSSCSDPDFDGISNDIDIDDDNDGILDTTENTCGSSMLYYSFDANNNASTSNSSLVSTSTALTFGAGVSGDGTHDAGSIWLYASTINAANLAGAITNNDYLAFSFTTPATLAPNNVLSGFSFLEVNSRRNFKFAIAYSTNNFATPGNVIYQDDLINDVAGVKKFNVTNINLLPNFTYSFRIYLYSVSASPGNNNVPVDEMYIYGCSPDSDGDGVINSLDIDADNDGIVDNIEGQTTSGYIAPSGTVNAQGLWNNYGTGITPTNTDGLDTPDYLDTDSDNDFQDDLTESYTNTSVPIIDTDFDGLIDAFDLVVNSASNFATNSSNTQTPLSFPDVDTPGGDRDWREILDHDRDGVNDVVDLDDDNDGILDSNELVCTPVIDLQNFSVPASVSYDSHPYFAFNTGYNGIISNSNSATIDGAGVAGGNFLVFNTASGAPTPGLEVEIYGSKGTGITVTPSTDYVFRFAYANMNTVQPVALEVYINNKLYAGNLVTTGSGNASWRTFTILWNSGSNTKLDYSIRSNDDFTIAGVDFLLDEIAVTPVCDFDGDGVLNHFDLDADNDGIPDVIEAGGSDPDFNGIIGTGYGSTATGAGTFSTANGTYGTPLSAINTDTHGQANFLDIDSDNDGIVDNVEAQATATYIVPGTYTDADSDGINDIYDVYNSKTNTAGAMTAGAVYLTPVNTDGYDSPDYTDLDSDNDGVTDPIEGWDTDGDKIANILYNALDIDNDGLVDVYDSNNALVNASDGKTPTFYPDVINPGADRDWRQLQDYDYDGIPDANDIDDDNDGILDITENTCGNSMLYYSFDANNNASTSNSSLVSTSTALTFGAGVSGDGTHDAGSIWLYASTINAANLAGAITNNDYLAFSFTTPATLAPNNVLSGFSFLEEATRRNFKFAIAYSLNNFATPGNVIYQDDLLNDVSGVKKFNVSNINLLPNLTYSFRIYLYSASSTPGNDNTPINEMYLYACSPDSDGDGIINSLDIDADNDGIIDNIEGQTTLGYIAPSGTVNAQGLWNNYGTGITPTNTDGTDDPDYLDNDSDNDTVNDIIEGNDFNGDNKTDVDYTLVDTDLDGLIDAFDTIIKSVATSITNYTNNNTLPTSFPDFDNIGGDRDWRQVEDTDYDGVSNFVDTDDDNDGILDTVEGLSLSPINWTAANLSNFITTPFTAPIGSCGNIGFKFNNTTSQIAGIGDSGASITPVIGYDLKNSSITGTYASLSTYSPNNANIANMELTLTPGQLEQFNMYFSDLEYTSVQFQAYDASNHLLPTQDWSYQTFEASSPTLSSDTYSNIIKRPTEYYFTANALDLNNDIFRVRFGKNTLAKATKIVITFHRNDTTNTDGDATLYAFAGICSKDFDGDGVANYMDLDSDNDGITDVIEAGGADPDNNGHIGTGYGATITGAGTFNATTGLYGTALTPVNTDGHGNPNYLDIDSDNDGIVDNIEAQATATYLAPGTYTDTDHDGLNDIYDVYNQGTHIAVPITPSSVAVVPVNTDGTDSPDYTDTDADNDGDSDALEGWDTNNDNIAEVLYNSTDTDNDGLVDNYDANDALADVSNGQSPSSFPDLDAPGGDRDWRQLKDHDNDGIGDIIDIDDDNDGILDSVEGCSSTSSLVKNGDFSQGNTNWTFNNIASFNNEVFYNSDIDNVTAPDGTLSQSITGLHGVVNANGYIPLSFDFKPNNYSTVANLSFNVSLNGTDYATIMIPAASGASTISTINGAILSPSIASLPDNVYTTVKLLIPKGSIPNSANLLFKINNCYACNSAMDDLYIDNVSIACAGIADNDGDGIPNAFDLDADNDGVYDMIEAGGNFTSHDTNHDGRVDGAVGANGWPDLVDNTAAGTVLPVADKDADGKKNFLDLDSDNDGILDIWESLFYIPNLDPDGDGKVGTGNTPADADSNGIADIVDGNNVTGLANISSASYYGDRDGDGIPNQLDIDADNDGIVDNIEGQSTSGYIAPSGTDTDGDGVDNVYDVNNSGTAIGYVNTDGGSAPDYVDTDSDNDGLKDLAENHLLPSGSLNPSEVDANNDGVLDIGSFTDTDGDGLANIFDLVNGITTTNNVSNGQLPTNQPNLQFPTTYERDWREAPDTDKDGVIDSVDIDDDNDGILDTAEGHTPTSDRDTDNDGIPDYLDLDSDNDGIYDVVEVGGIDPDQDGYPGTRPVATTYPAVEANGLPAVLSSVPFALQDFDGDGYPNQIDLDADNDGIYDVLENGGLDPNNDGMVGNATYIDVDSDGINDIVDNFNNKPTNNSNAVISGTPLAVLNTDGADGPNYLDLDSDNDSCFDAIEGGGNITALQLSAGAISGAVDTRGVPTATPTGQSVDISQNALASGCQDADNDGVNDSADLDDDNDGILDTIEGSGDLDGDGIINSLDLDSDGDGCFDALEGNDNVKTAQLNPNGSINTIANGGIGATIAIDLGVPNLVNVSGLADTDNAVAQALGTSQNSSVSACFIDAVNDINQTPTGITATGNIFTNDEVGIGSVTLQSASIPLGTATAVSGTDVNGILVANAGLLTLNTDGTYTFVPSSGFNGSVNVNYTAVNQVGNIDTATLAIKVIPSVSNNFDFPVAQNDHSTTEKDKTLASSVMINDSDPENLPIYLSNATVGITPITLGTDFTIQGYDASGTLVNAGTINITAGNQLTSVQGGTYVYTPAAGFVGNTLPINYKIVNTNGDVSSAVLTISVLPDFGNQVFANDDAQSVIKGLPTSGSITTNDFDPENNSISVSSASAIVNGITTPLVLGSDVIISGVGKIKLNLNGTYEFIPLSSFVGTVVIPYTVCDNASTPACDQATLYLTSLDSPFIDAQNDINQIPGGVVANGNLLNNDSSESTGFVVDGLIYADASGVAQPLTLGAATPTNIYDEFNTLAGSIIVNADGTYNFVPAIGYTGTVSMQYFVTDISGNIDSATFTIKVLSKITTGNEKPIAQDDTASTEVGTTVTSSVLVNDSDPNTSDVLTVSSASIPLGIPTVVSGTDISGNTIPNAGTITLNSNGTYTFVPTAGFEGNIDSINYTVSDSHGGTDTANISIAVLPNKGNDTFANDDAQAAPKGTTMSGNVLTNDFDPEGDIQNVSSVTVNGTNIPIGVATAIPSGTITVNANGTYTFIPNASFIGTTSIVYVVCDNATVPTCDTANLYLTSLDGGACYKPATPSFAGIPLPSEHGITSLGRAGTDADNWPMVRNGAWTVLESKTKGFVINRMPSATTGSYIGEPVDNVDNPVILNPIKGMMYYDTTTNCLKINIDGTRAGWRCFNTQGCPTVN